jgi:hypothetical protein
MATGLIANGSASSSGITFTYTPQSNAKVCVVLSTSTAGANFEVNGANYGLVYLSSYYYAPPTETHMYAAAGVPITFTAYSLTYTVSAIEENS